MSRITMNGAPPIYRPLPERIPAPPVYRPQPNNKAGVQLRPTNPFRVETRSAPPVYRPQSAMQPKPATDFRLETRPAPAVYRPQTPNQLPVAQRSSEPVVRALKVNSEFHRPAATHPPRPAAL